MDTGRSLNGDVMKGLIACGALVFGAAALLGACGGSDSKSPTNSSAAKESTGPSAATSGASTAANPTTASKPSGQGTLPADPCALLTADEVHAILPTAGDGQKANEAGGPGQQVVVCHWELSDAVGTIDVKVSTLPTGISPDTIKSSYGAEAKDSGRVLDGIGDFAIVTSVITADTEVKVLTGTLLLDVELQQLGAKDKQDAVIALAKAALGRL